MPTPFVNLLDLIGDDLRLAYAESLAQQKRLYEMYGPPKLLPPPPPPTFWVRLQARVLRVRERLAKWIAPWLLTEDDYYDRRHEEDDW